jgi:glutathione S-transferase
VYQLHYYPGNVNLAPHIPPEEIGADHELVPVDRSRNEHESPEFLMLNPIGRTSAALSTP